MRGVREERRRDGEREREREREDGERGRRGRVGAPQSPLKITQRETRNNMFAVDVKNVHVHGPKKEKKKKTLIHQKYLQKDNLNCKLSNCWIHSGFRNEKSRNLFGPQKN